MVSILQSMCSILTFIVRSKRRVITQPTEREYTHRFNLRIKGGRTRAVVFRCREYEHTLTNGWYWWGCRRHYSYAVEMIRVGDDTFIDHHIGHYPLLCGCRHVKTYYPHRCAINAHLDALVNQ